MAKKTKNLKYPRMPFLTFRRFHSDGLFFNLEHSRTIKCFFMNFHYTYNKCDL